MEHIDDVILNFNTTGIFFLNVCLAFIMFGIALDIRWSHFKIVVTAPKSLLLGLSAQLLLLPFITFLLILWLEPIPSMALGMIMVASCPGGNISNFMSAVAGANIELSIVMTCITSLLAVFLTPFNLALYGSMYEPTNAILVTVSLDWLDVIQTIGIIIIIPIILGRIVDSKYPQLSNKLKKPLRLISMFLFLIIVAGALASNFDYFIEYINQVFGLVFIHNGAALFIAFTLALVFGLNKTDKKTITIETGIQNSGLGLLLIFGFFKGLGGMAIIAAWWGIWHIISGFTVAFLFKKYA